MSEIRVGTRQELLDSCELNWAPTLRRVSLVAEAEIIGDQPEEVVAALGYFYNKYRNAGAKVLKRWPACLVASMTGIAVTEYQHGTYWPKLWKKAGYEGAAADQQVWGEAFIASVNRFELPTFSHSSQHYVGLILMHAGIPVYCLGDYFRLLLERRRQDPGMDADGFLAWATAPGRELRLSELDKPAQRFLLHGGEYAHDVVERTLDLLDRLTEADPDLDGIGLPGYLIEAARREYADGYLDLRARLTHGRTRRQLRPRLALDPFGQGVHLLLPAVGDMPDGEALWRVSVDGESRTIRSRAAWVGASEAAPQTSFPLSRPVRTALISLGGREDLAAEIRVVDPADPVLFFADDGRRLPGNVSLPRAPVWIMHPADHELEFKGDPGQLTEPAVPYGWDGWRLRLITLHNVTAVSLKDCPVHHVELHARPSLLLTGPVPGVATPYGSPVYPELPKLDFPEGTDPEISWQVELRRSADRQLVYSHAVKPGDGADIWENVPRPVLGGFDIAVRGPLGRGISRAVFIAEGISVRYQPEPRVLARNGLERGTAWLSGPPSVTVSPECVRYEPGERTRLAEYRTAFGSESLMITPPHAAVLCSGAGFTSWSASPLNLETETIAMAGRLLVRVPNLSEQPWLEVQLNGERIQIVEPSGTPSPGLAGFELTRAADTITAHGRAELMLNTGGQVMPLALIRPRRLASGAGLGYTLVLSDHTPVDGLTAGAYLVFAPWRSPVQLAVSEDGTAVLPPELVGSGPMRVLLRIDDPWTVNDWPAWPGPDAYACAAPGVPDDDLSRFIAGLTDVPVVTGHLDRLWRLIDLSAELIRAGARLDLAQRCTDELRQQSRAALLALPETGLSHAQVTRALVETGLAAAILDESPWEPAELSVLERLWATLPAAAAICSGGLLARDDVAEAAIAQCGEDLSAVLRGDPDPDAVVGRFGPEAEMMAVLPPDRVEALWQAAAVVPRALLDADTRLMAARRMFDVRSRSSVTLASHAAKGMIRSVQELVKGWRPELAAAFKGRMPAVNWARAPGWLYLPAMSLSLALVARMAARGDTACQALERRYRDQWASLAKRAPDLVAIDLVLAEALIIGAFTPIKTEEAPDDDGV